MPKKNFSKLWLWVGPYPLLPPIGVLTINGQWILPAYMSSNFEACWSSWSNIKVVKSPNIISRIALPPARTYPDEIPVIAASLIGVLKTWLGYLILKSFVTLNAPPYSLGLKIFLSSISSPNKIRSLFCSNRSFNVSLINELYLPFSASFKNFCGCSAKINFSFFFIDVVIVSFSKSLIIPRISDLVSFM